MRAHHVHVCIFGGGLMFDDKFEYDNVACFDVIFLLFSS